MLILSAQNEEQLQTNTNMVLLLEENQYNIGRIAAELQQKISRTSSEKSTPAYSHCITSFYCGVRLQY